MKSQLASILALAAALTLTGCPGTLDEQAADRLIDTFGKSCPTQGEWTEQALAQSRALTSVFESLKRDNLCTAMIDNVIATSNALEQVLSRLSANESRARQSAARGHAILSELSNTTDPDLTSALKSAYVSEKIELISAQSERNEWGRSSGPGGAEASLGMLNQQILRLMSQTDALSSCLSEKSGSIYQLGASLLSVTANLAPPLVGMGIAAAESLFSWTIDLISTMPYTEKIIETRKSRMRVAISCGLESLTTQYCKARDTQRILEYTAGQFVNRSWRPAEQFWGVDLLDRHLASFQHWVDHMLNGTEPADRDAGNRVSEKKGILNLAESMRTRALAEIGYWRQGTGTPQENSRKALKRIVLEIFYIGTGGVQAFEGVSDLEMVMALTGRTAEEIPKFNGSAVDWPGVAAAKGEFVVGSLNGLESRVRSVTQKEIDSARDRFTLTIIPHPDQFLLSFSDEDLRTISPRAALEYSLDFLSRAWTLGGQKPAQPRPTCVERGAIKPIQAHGGTERDREEQHIEEACALVRKVLNLALTRSVDTTSPALEPAAAIAEIAKVLVTLGQNILFPALMQRLILNDLVARAQYSEPSESPFSPELETLMVLGQEDITRTLRQVPREKAHDELEDLLKAQSITAHTTDILRQAMFPAIEVTVGSFHESPEFAHTLPMQHDRYVHDRLCLLAFTTGQEWSEKLQDYCKDAQIVSVFPGSQIRLALADLQKEQNLAEQLERTQGEPWPKTRFETYACRYYDFLQRNRVYSLRKGLTRSQGQGQGYGYDDLLPFEALSPEEFFKKADSLTNSAYYPSYKELFSYRERGWVKKYYEFR